MRPREETLEYEGRDVFARCLWDLNSNCMWWELRRKGSTLGPKCSVGLPGWVVMGSAWEGTGAGPYKRKGQWGESLGSSWD